MVKKGKIEVKRISLPLGSIFVALISGYPHSGFPRGAFALVPRRFADS